MITLTHVNSGTFSQKFPPFPSPSLLATVNGPVKYTRVPNKLSQEKQRPSIMACESKEVVYIGFPKAMGYYSVPTNGRKKVKRRKVNIVRFIYSGYR